MKLYEAKNIIKDVFERSFDKEKYSYFVRNLLKNLHTAEFIRTGYNIPKAFTGFISLYERIGKYEDEEGNLIDVLIVKLNRDHSIDFARSTQRNFVRWYLNSKDKDAALVAFHTDKSTEWRFSFIKMQYSLEKKKDELTPAKRSSFMVGEKGKSHTAQCQLVNLLKNDYAPFLSDIEEAFNIEAVSDEFYEKYKTLLFNLVDEMDTIVKNDIKIKTEFEGKNISILNFSKKLLGQIVFLYFIQKKGWLGLDEKQKYGDGNKNFLRTLFQNVKHGENFFNDYLEFLFYDALSKKRETDYYEKFKTRIPFLNGGLFDPIEFYDWEKTDIVIPNRLFSDRKDNEEGTGILDVFDLYNFTVKEDEPLDTEVAIDPEMLGKVFERMLEVTERKSKGAFYTPREIVHYMAQSSLLYYLQSTVGISINDLEKFIHYGEHIIDKDIAIEEGKYSQTRNKQQIPESIRKNADKIDKALKDIKICDPAVGSGAFPVGVMNEIVKLRKLLTPFVIASGAKQSREERNAYHFKANAIQNSIYGVDIDAGAVEIAKLRLWLSMVVDENRIDNIEPLPNLDYKIVKGNSLIGLEGVLLNDKALKKINEKKDVFFNATEKEIKRKLKSEIDQELNKILSLAKEFGIEADFDFRLFFWEVFNEFNGFDIVIGNPPYVVDRNLSKYEKKHFKSYYKSALYQINLYLLFIEKSFRILKKHGNTNLIVPNTWLINKAIGKFREFLLKEYHLLKITDLTFENVFKATVLPIVFIGRNAKLNDYKISIINSENYQFSLRSEISKKEIFIDENILINYQISDNEWGILNKMETDVIYMNNVSKTSFGVKFYQVGKGIPKQTREIVNNHSFTHNSIINDHCKKVLEGKNINRFETHFNGKYIEYGEWLAEPRNPEMFEGERILLRRIVSEKGLIATLIIGDWCNNSLLHVIKLIDSKISIKYVLALLNSSLIGWYFIKKFARNEKTFPEIRIHEINRLPLKNISNQDLFVIIVDYLLFLKQLPKDEMSFYFEQIIDGMVYELYFENELKQAGCDILKYLNDLPAITEEMSDAEKLKTITAFFNKLYDKNSPVRKNLFFMDSVEEIAIIKKGLEK